MVKISKAQGAGAASNYFEKEYSNARENYYTEGEKEEVRGEYFGGLAAEMGLAGEVSGEDFHRLIEGQDPRTGAQLIRHVSPKKYTNKIGREVTTREHRAGWDIVFSCPKSVSLTAGPGGDKRIPGLQREAVIETLREMEKRIAGKDGHRGHRTGKMAAAIFQHDCARPDREAGYAAPDLHDHVFVMNMTRDETGKYRAVEIDSLFRVRDFATQLHWSKLVEKMSAIGYEFERSPRTGAPEIKGFSAEYVAENSKRRGEVLRNEARLKREARQAGFTVEGKSLRGKAARMERRSKKFDREEMRARHREVDAEFGHQARKAVEHARARGPVIRMSEDLHGHAREAVTFARDHVFEREAVAGRTEIEKQALRRGWGLTTYDAIKAEIDKRIEAGELLEIERGRGPEMTSREMLDLERANLAKARAGRGTERQIVDAGVVDLTIREAAERAAGVRLNDSQHKAVREILTSGDQVMGLQGYAGTGKTTTLATLRHILERKGYSVYGLAPLTRAANLLADSGIRATTLQRFVISDPQRSPGPRYYILDESSLADTRSMNAFFKRLAPADRVLLVGDKAQHQAIGAGAPFEQFQRAGMRTATLDEIVRQKEPGLKKVVELFSKERPREAVELLIKQDRVTEIESPHDRMRAIARDYCATPGALVICPRNDERVEQNRMIHSALQDAGKIGREDYEVSVYVSRDVTKKEREFAGAYQVGDVVRYSRGSKEHGVKAREYWEVVKVDRENNQLTALAGDGRTATYDPRRLRGVSVYREETRLFATGERIQFRAPLTAQKVGTNDLGVIEKFDGRRLTVELEGEKQRRITIDLDKFKHLDHGYAMTSISSQGLGAHRVIFNADAHEFAKLLNERTGYVATSRAIYDMRIYTNSVEGLPAALDRRNDNEIVIDPDRQPRAPGGATDTRGEGPAGRRAQQAQQPVRPIRPIRPIREDVSKQSEPVGRQAGQETPRQGAAKGTPARGIEADRADGGAKSNKSWRTEFMEAEKGKVVEVIRALEKIVEAPRREPHVMDREMAGEIRAHAQYAASIADSLPRYGGDPDVRLKSELTGACERILWLGPVAENGRMRSDRDVVIESVQIAGNALKKIKPELLTWELARSVSPMNENWYVIDKAIGQGARVERLWTNGVYGEGNRSVFGIRGLAGTYVAHDGGIDHSKRDFSETMNRIRSGADLGDTKNVREIEYDHARVMVEERERIRQQSHEQGRGREREPEGYGRGFSR